MAKDTVYFRETRSRTRCAFVRCKTTSGYEAMILTPEQAYAIVCNLREPERTLTLLAAGTGLRISECLGLQWQDVNFADAMIHVRRTWTCGQVGLPKSKASKGPVPLHPLLAEFMLLWKQKTTYSQARDWVFPSTRLNGKQPRVANMLVEDHLRPAAVKAGTPHLTPKQIDLLHTIWLELSNDVAPEEIHHHDVIHFALEELRKQLSDSQREDVLRKLRQHLQEIRDRRVPQA